MNKVRKYLFAQKSREIENIPPTTDALEEHAKRAIYQACHVWGQSTHLFANRNCYHQHYLSGNHETADTRVILHTLDPLRNGASKILIRRVDTDVVVLDISLYLLSFKSKWKKYG